MAMSRTDQVIAEALEEVARAKALRERALRDRQRNFGNIPVRQSVYVLAVLRKNGVASCNNR